MQPAHFTLVHKQYPLLHLMLLWIHQHHVLRTTVSMCLLHHKAQQVWILLCLRDPLVLLTILWKQALLLVSRFTAMETTKITAWKLGTIYTSCFIVKMFTQCLPNIIKQPVHTWTSQKQAHQAQMIHRYMLTQLCFIISISWQLAIRHRVII